MSHSQYSDSLAPLLPLLNDVQVTAIMINSYDNIYVERNGQLERVATPFRDNDQILTLINAIVEPMGRRVDECRPYVDARLPDGSRVNAVIPPISLTGPTLTIRKFSAAPLTIQDLVGFGTLTQDMADFLRACVIGRCNVVIAGNLGSGKTTLLNCIGNMVPDDERIITVESAAELQISKKRLITLESRPANAEGKGEVTTQNLLVNALRMRPDRIIVGAVRGGEALEVLQAMSTGHDGTMCSVTAGSVRDVPVRLQTMALMADASLPTLRIHELIASALDVIVYQERLRDGTRKVVNVAEVLGMSGDEIAMQDIYVFRQTGFREGRVIGQHTATGVIPKFFGRFRAVGIELPVEMFTPE